MLKDLKNNVESDKTVWGMVGGGRGKVKSLALNAKVISELEEIEGKSV